MLAKSLAAARSREMGYLQNPEKSECTNQVAVQLQILGMYSCALGIVGSTSACLILWGYTEVGSDDVAVVSSGSSRSYNSGNETALSTPTDL